MANGKFVSYLRVSTAKQGKSGLGLDAQREAINNYLNGGSWEVLKEFVEIESGKNNNRPKLKEALEFCQMTGATLIIAKLDRLARNVAFISNLMESGVEFVACDLPQANKFTIHILAAVAEHEREMISKRTKDALKAAKAKGVKLGSPQNLNHEARQKGSKEAVSARKTKANQFAQKLYPMVSNLREKGLSLNAIAREFNKNGILTARGKRGNWTPTAVKNLLERVKQPK